MAVSGELGLLAGQLGLFVTRQGELLDLSCAVGCDLVAGLKRCLDGLQALLELLGLMALGIEPQKCHRPQRLLFNSVCHHVEA